MKTTSLLFVLSFLFLTVTFAQEDSTDTENTWEWEWEEMDFGFDESHPAISLTYGLSDMMRKDFSGSFIDPYKIDLKLGHIKKKPAWDTDNIFKHKFKYLYLSYFNGEIADGENLLPMEFQSAAWQFGFGSSSGYGYELSRNFSIIPYNASSLDWTRIDVQQKFIEIIPEKDQEIIAQYDESFRFGSSMEAGIRFQINTNYILEAGYERSIVFQRHLFWKWAGSAIIEGISQGLLDNFIDEVFESSPVAGPIMYFLLKNSLSYGLYELRQEKMNWPFNSESPITYDSFNFGVTIMF